MMARLRLSILVILACVGSAGVRAQNAVHATGIRDTMRNVVSSYGKLPTPVGAGQLLRLSVVDGMLVGETNAGLPTQGLPMRVEVEGSDAVWVVTKRTLAGPNPIFVTVTRYDFNAPADHFWNVSLNLRSNFVTAMAQSGDNSNGRRIRYSQSNGAVSLTCTSVAQGAQTNVFNATANSIRQLQTEHPDEVRMYLNPMIRDLTGRTLLRPQAGDVYRAFDAIPANPSTAARVEELLPRLDADAYSVRDQAGRDLAGLGAAGVLAVLRHGSVDLSAEARKAVDLFIAQHSSGTAEQPSEARQNAAFLLDCLDDPDRAVRDAAKAALEKLLGKSVMFDAGQSEEARQGAIETIRQMIGRETRPATLPATRPKS